MPEFLPISRADMQRRGWEQCDFVYIIGDGYVDHPSFGHAIISRVLEDAGYKVGIISQPDWKNPASINALGEPRLGFLVMGGNMDSMVNHYSVSKKHRQTDAFTPGGVMGKRPDYAVTVYCNLIRQTYKKAPIIIGGIEASLRRLAHYDYWSDKLKRSILLDAQADLLLYGMGERKYEKYGAAFFSVIDAYRADHPDAVLSLDPPAPEPEKPLPSEKKKKPPKAERPAFYLTAEDARSFNYQDSYTGAELKAALIEAAGDPDVKAPTIKEIDEWLLAQRLIGMERLPTKGFYYVPTPAGVDAGLRSEDKVSARGTPYSVLLFTPEAQRMVVEHFIKPD